MKDLTFTQEYTLCVLNKVKKNKDILYEGKYPGGIAISAFLELLISDKIGFDDKKKVILKGSAENDKEYLNIVCKDILNLKPKTLKIWIEYYLAGLSSKPIKAIVNAAINSLIDNECVSIEKKNGLFKDHITYNTEISQVDYIVEKLRAELLENGEITMETVILTSLLQQSDILKDYFSKHEHQLLKARIEEIKKSEIWAKASIIKEILDELYTLLIVVLIPGII
jgi:hypothetical protein